MRDIKSLEEIETKLEELIKFVDSAVKEVEEGSIPNLGSLDVDVENICHGVNSLAPEEAQKVAPKIQEMISGIETFEIALQKSNTNSEEEE